MERESATSGCRGGSESCLQSTPAFLSLSPQRSQARDPRDRTTASAGLSRRAAHALGISAPRPRQKGRTTQLLCLHPAPPSFFLPPPPPFQARLTRRGGMRFRRGEKGRAAREKELRRGGGAGRLPEGRGGPSLRPLTEERPRPAERPKPADTTRDHPRSRGPPTPARDPPKGRGPPTPTRDPPRGGTRRSPGRPRVGRTLRKDEFATGFLDWIDQLDLFCIWPNR